MHSSYKENITVCTILSCFCFFLLWQCFFNPTIRNKFRSAVCFSFQSVFSADANEAEMPINAYLKAACNSLKSDVKLPPGKFCGWLIIFSAQIVTLAGNQPFIYKEIKFGFDQNKHHLFIPMGRVWVIRSGKEEGLVEHRTKAVMQVMTTCKNVNNGSSEPRRHVKRASLAFTSKLNKRDKGAYRLVLVCFKLDCNINLIDLGRFIYTVEIENITIQSRFYWHNSTRCYSLPFYIF